MNIIRHIVIVPIFVTLSACGGGGNSEPLPQEDSTTIFEDTSSTIRGVDNNSNGVRDDIEGLVSRDFSSSIEEKTVALGYAKSLQTFIEAETKEEAISGAENLARSVDCVYATFPDPVEHYEQRSKIINKIESWTANTEKRANKYLLSNKIVSGILLEKSQSDTCKQGG